MGGPCRTVGTREAGSDNGREVGGPIDEIAATKSLSLYCKPVELYNIIRSRANLRVLVLATSACQVVCFRCVALGF